MYKRVCIPKAERYYGTSLYGNTCMSHKFSPAR